MMMMMMIAMYVIPSSVAVGYVEKACPANQSAIVTVRNGRPAGPNDPQSV